METVLGETMDAGSVARLLAEPQVGGVHAVSIDEGKNGTAAG